MIGRWPYWGLKTVRIELGLLLADARVLARSFSFDQRQWLAIIAAQHIINVADAGRVRHSPHFNFNRIWRLRVEAGLAQQKVNEQVAGLRFAVVVGVSDRLVRGLSGGNLGLEGFDLGLKRRPTSLADAPRGFRVLARLNLLLEAASNVLQFRERDRRHLRNAWQRLYAEVRVGRRLCTTGISAREPIGDVKEFAQAAGSLGGRYWPTVRGCVAGVLHKAGLDGERPADQHLEAWLGEQRRQRPVVRVFQRAVVPVNPTDGGLQCQPAVERRGPWVGMGQRLGARGVTKNLGKLGLQEGELRHRHRSGMASNHSIGGVSQLSTVCAILKHGQKIG